MVHLISTDSNYYLLPALQQQSRSHFFKTVKVQGLSLAGPAVAEKGRPGSSRVGPAGPAVAEMGLAGSSRDGPGRQKQRWAVPAGASIAMAVAGQYGRN